MNSGKTSASVVWGKIKKIFLENWRYIALAVGMTILSFLLTVVKLRELEISLHSKKALLIFLVLILLTIGVCSVLYLAKIKKWKIEKVFLVVCKNGGKLW